MKKLFPIIAIFVMSGCSENSFDSCVSEVEKVLYESWEKNHTRSIKIPSYDEKKYCLSEMDEIFLFGSSTLRFSSTQSDSIYCKSRYSFLDLPPTTDEEKRIFKNAQKDSRDGAVMRCSSK
jgi:hypothetical protein